MAKRSRRTHSPAFKATRGVSKPEAAPPDLKELHAKIGQQALEIDF